MEAPNMRDMATYRSRELQEAAAQARHQMRDCAARLDAAGAHRAKDRVMAIARELFRRQQIGSEAAGIAAAKLRAAR
jgi:hypothetical protein